MIEEKIRIVVVSEDKKELKTFSHAFDAAPGKTSAIAELQCIDLTEMKEGRLLDMDLESSPGVVVLLSPSMVQKLDFLTFLSAAVCEVKKRINFRLFICFTGMTSEDLWKLGSEDGSTLSKTVIELAETVQIIGIQSIPEMAAKLSSYLIQRNDETRLHLADLATQKRVTETGKRFSWMRFTLLMWLVILLIISGIGSKSTGLAGWVEGRDQICHFSGIEFLIGLFATLASVDLLFFSFNSIRITFKIPNFDRDLMMSAFVIGFTLWLMLHPRFSIGLFTLGYVIGWVIEELFRRGFRSRLFLQAMLVEVSFYLDNKSVATKVGGKIDSNIYKAALGITDNYKRCQIFSSKDESGSVFISYSRRSTWSEERATELTKAFRENKIPCFLDRDCIPEGSHWRHHLYKNINRQILFITLLDDITAKSHWAAAELESALRSVSSIASPQIAVIAEHNYWVNTDKHDTLPVFGTVGAALESKSGVNWRMPFGYFYQEDTWPDVFEHLKSIARLRMGLLGPRISRPVYMLRQLFSKACQLATPIAFILTVVSLFFYDAAEHLGERMSQMHAFLAVLLMVCAFLGYLLVKFVYLFKHRLSLWKKIIVGMTIIGVGTFCILGAMTMSPMSVYYLISVMLLGAMQAQSKFTAQPRSSK